jgi:hypothetical protein
MAEPSKYVLRGQILASGMTAETGQRTEHITMQNLNIVTQVGNKSTDKMNGYGSNYSYTDCNG